MENSTSSSADSLLLQLLTVIKNKKTEEVRSVIEQLGGYINLKLPNDADGHSLIHKVVKLDDQEILKLFFGSKYVNFNVKDNYGLTALHEAAQAGNTEIVKLLLNSGADVSSRNKHGKTPLHYLLSHNVVNEKMVKLLLEYNPDVNIKDEKGEICLFDAIRRHKLEVVKLLVGRGSDVNRKNNDGQTPLHLAAIYWVGLEIIKCLWKNGADANALNIMGETPVLLLFKSIYLGYSEKTLLFLLNYSDINVIDKMGYNFFSFVAIIYMWKTFLEHIAKLKVLEVSINQRIIDSILNQANCKYRDYFLKCEEELISTKSTKVENSCWVTFFNILTDNRRKLKNYAGNVILIKEFEKSDCIEKFPIYGLTMEKNVKKGIERRKLFDKSAGMLSNNWPIFGPIHLIIRDILDCLATVDLSEFCE